MAPCGARRWLCQASGVLVLAIACVVSAAAWVYLVAAHGGFWRTGQRLPARRRSRGGRRSCGAGRRSPPWSRRGTRRSPCRSRCPRCSRQDYPGEFRVFLVDDNSDDGTGAVAAELGEKAAARRRRAADRRHGQAEAGRLGGQGLGDGAGLRGRTVGARGPVGQRAGLRAVHRRGHRLGAARAARPGARRAEADDRALVSQMALLRAETSVGAGDRARVRLLLRAALPVPQGQRPAEPDRRGGGRLHADQAGPRWRRPGGLEPIKGALIDDVALGTLLKRNGNRTWLGLTTDIRSARPYPSLASLWHMIARSAYVQLRYNPLLLAGTIVGLLLLYVAPPAGVIAALIAVTTGSGGRAARRSPGWPGSPAGR